MGGGLGAPARRPAAAHRPRPVRRRHPAARHAARPVRALHGRARARSPRSTCPQCVEVPGVVAAYTAADLDIGDIVARLDRPPEEFTPTAMPVLARDRVRFVGEPIAIVVARDPYAVEDGVEAAVVPTRGRAGDRPASRPRSLRTPPWCTTRPRRTPWSTCRCSPPRASTRSSPTRPCVVRGREPAAAGRTRCRWRPAAWWRTWDERDDQLLVQTCTQVPHQVRTLIGPLPAPARAHRPGRRAGHGRRLRPEVRGRPRGDRRRRGGAAPATGR